MSWTNSDGLYVKFGTEKSAISRGGEHTQVDGRHTINFRLDYTDLASATPVILGSTTGTETGSFGVMVPKGLFIEQIEIVCETALTTADTIGSITLQMGLIREDRTTAYDDDGFLTSSFVIGTASNAVGEKATINVGSTGAGAFLGTTLANDGLIQVCNTGHASHQMDTGRWNVRIIGYYPNP